MRAKYRVEITQTAESDVEEIWTQIGADSIENATRFLIQLEQKIEFNFILSVRLPFETNPLAKGQCGLYARRCHFFILGTAKCELKGPSIEKARAYKSDFSGPHDCRGRQAAFQINISADADGLSQPTIAILLFVKGIAIAQRTPR